MGFDFSTGDADSVPCAFNRSEPVSLRGMAERITVGGGVPTFISVLPIATPVRTPRPALDLRSPSAISFWAHVAHPHVFATLTDEIFGAGGIQLAGRGVEFVGCGDHRSRALAWTRGFDLTGPRHVVLSVDGTWLVIAVSGEETRRVRLSELPEMGQRPLHLRMRSWCGIADVVAFNGALTDAQIAALGSTPPDTAERARGPFHRHACGSSSPEWVALLNNRHIHAVGEAGFGAGLTTDREEAVVNMQPSGAGHVIIWSAPNLRRLVLRNLVTPDSGIFLEMHDVPDGVELHLPDLLRTHRLELGSGLERSRLGSVHAPKVERIGGLSVEHAPHLRSMHLPALRETMFITMQDAPVLETFDAPLLTKCSDVVTLQNLPRLRTFNAPGLQPAIVHNTALPSLPDDVVRNLRSRAAPFRYARAEWQLANGSESYDQARCFAYLDGDDVEVMAVNLARSNSSRPVFNYTLLDEPFGAVTPRTQLLGDRHGIRRAAPAPAPSPPPPPAPAPPPPPPTSPSAEPPATPAGRRLIFRKP